MSANEWTQHGWRQGAIAGIASICAVAAFAQPYPGKTIRIVKSGRLRPLAVTATRNFALLPDLPTVAATVPGYEAGIWYGVLATAGTPAAVVAKLNSEIVRQLHAPEVKARLEADGSEPIGNSPSEFGAVIRAELQRWAKVVRDTGVRAD